MAGRPVKVHWSRVEELQWGTLRPMAVIDVRAGLDATGALAAWDFLDINGGPAALGSPYAAAAVRLRSQPARSPLRQGSYRALGANANNFARESAIDELVQASAGDPLEFRLDHLGDDRLVTVLRAAIERFGWSSVAPAAGATPSAPVGSRIQTDVRTGCGLAVGLEKGGRVATCAEVRVGGDDEVAVTRVVTAYECGTVVNRDTVVGQIEGATMMALGGALLEAVPVEHGRFLEPSLAHYPVPRFRDMPEIEVVLLDRPDLPSAGAGETPMIAVAPAVANAIFAATGRRLRDMPMAPGGRLRQPGHGGPNVG
jgi:isoquinoline 1-oxidoreductase